jgi:cytochrome c-type biogenesis protein CcmH
MKRLALVAWLIAPLLLASPTWAADIPMQFSDPAQAARYEALLAQLRCLVCQNQSLADSNADLAQDLRQDVYRMMQSGDSDDKIIAFLVARYGDFVLYRPRVKPVTYLLWFGPAILLLIGGFVVARFIRRRGAQADTSFTEQEQQRIADLLEAGETKDARP